MNPHRANGLAAIDSIGDRNDDARVRRETEQAAYAAFAWLVALPPPASRPHELQLKTLGVTKSAASADWRSTDGRVTSGAGAPEESTSEIKADAGRVTMDAHTEAFGNIRLIVARKKEGVSILLAVEQHSMAAADMQRSALMRALEGAGLHVASVQITRLTEDGLAIAPSASGSPGSTGDVLDIAGASSNVGRTEPVIKRLLNTIG